MANYSLSERLITMNNNSDKIKKSGHGAALGKLILIGEHSVVYGKLSVGLPFSAVTINVHLTENPDKTLINSSMYSGTIDKIPYFIENIYSVYTKIKQDFNINKYFFIDIESNIPVERGLGSSAAVAVALVRAFEDYLDIKLSIEDFLSYVDLSEKISHGNPSGLDARLITLNQPLLFQRNKKIETFYFDTPYYLVVADTGITGQTKEAVKDVRMNYESPYYARSQASSFYIEDLDRLAHGFYENLSKDYTDFDSLAKIIDSAHDDLRALQVSSPEQDFGINFAKKHGAASGKITGGGRGGCFYVLCKNFESAENIKNLIIDNKVGVDAWTVPLSSISMKDSGKIKP